MIFELGVGFAEMDCPICNTKHYNVSIGEEVVIICKCGSVCGFTDHLDYYEYGWFPIGQLTAGLTEALNGDKRNLC